MLSDQVLQLLTAFVDGELSQRQRRAVVRLLQKSSEAREVLKQMQENAHRVKKLPRRKADPAVKDEILQAIAVEKAQPRPPLPTPARRHGWTLYVAATMAASLLIAVIGLLVWNSMSDPQDKGNGFAKVDEPKPEVKKQPVTPTPRKLDPRIAQITEGAAIGGGSPIVPYSARFADLKKGGKAIDQFASELKMTKAVELDVTVKKNSEALARLDNVLKNQGIKLVTDPAAKKMVDKKNNTYLVYAENLTLDEVTKLMNELGDNYVVGLNNTQKNVETPFQKATVNALEKDAREKIAKALGEPAKANPLAKERVVIVLPSSGSTPKSAEVRQFVEQRRPMEPGTIQILIKIRQE